MDRLNLNIEWLDEVESTNTLLRERVLSATPPPDGTVLATTNQTAGRGRGDRVWIADKGENLCFSLYLAINACPAQMPSLGMAAGLAVDDMLHGLGIASNTKWPNDVRVEGKKICGILSERISRANAQGAVLGVGINVNMNADAAEKIGQPATSIAIENGRPYGSPAILDRLLAPLAARIKAWKQAGFAGIREQWMQSCEQTGKPVEVRQGQHVIEGVLQDFGTNGELILRLEDGRNVAVWSGDVQ